MCAAQTQAWAARPALLVVPPDVLAELRVALADVRSVGQQFFAMLADIASDAATVDVMEERRQLGETQPSPLRFDTRFTKSQASRAIRLSSERLPDASTVRSLLNGLCGIARRRGCV
jgi:hypothetical protein